MPDQTEIKCPDTIRCREDFPVEWEHDNYVSRREMVKFLTLGSLTIAGANAVVAGVPYFTKTQPMPRAKIALVSAVPVGGSLLFSYPTEKDPCILVRQLSGGLAAYSQVCTHLSCAVVHNVQENALFCPCHRGFFRLNDGSPYAGPPQRPLRRVKLEQQGEDIFAVGIEL